MFLCFAHQAKLKNITYVFDAAAEQITASVDVEEIQIAVFNLISNALKFTPEGGNITVRLKLENHWVYFEISDSGIGITDDVGERLFEKYYQVKDTNSLKTGFGIGLYLVKTFIERHQGSISYKSTAGNGTTFLLKFPQGAVKDDVSETILQTEWIVAYDDDLADQPSAANFQQINDLDLLISQQQKIVVIDDNEEIRN